MGRVLVGFSTEQNTANLVPALMVPDVDRFLPIETARAREGNWTEGLKRVLEPRGIACEPPLVLKTKSETDLTSIFNQVMDRIRQLEAGASVAWCIGGGTKQHALALWACFTDRSWPDDQVVYAEPGSGLFSLIDFENEELRQRQIPITVDLSLEEIVRCFGKYDVLETGSGPAARYPGGVAAQFLHQDFRERAYRYGEQRRQSRRRESLPDKTEEFLAWLKHSDQVPRGLLNEAALQSVIDDGQLENLKRLAENGNLRQVFAIITSAHRATLPSVLTTQAEIINPFQPYGIEKLADFFECVVFEKVDAALSSCSTIVKEVKRNVVIRDADGKQVAEYDVLLVTNRGTLISLDAKTFEFARKDHDARLRAIDRISGRMAQVWPVLPIDPGDVTSTWLPERLLRLPFELAERKSPFLIVASTGDDFWLGQPLKKNGDFRVSATQPSREEPGWVQCRNIDGLVRHLGIGVP